MTPLAKNLLKASFAGTYAETMLTPLYAGLTSEIGGTIGDAGLGYGILNLITGLIVVFVGRTAWFEANMKRMVFAGFTLAGVCDLLYLLVGNRWEFFGVQMLMGLAVGLLNPAWDALYSDDGEEASGKKWSFWTGGVSFVVGCSALTGAAVIHFFSFKVLFIFMAVCDTLAIYYSWRVMKEPASKA